MGQGSPDEDRRLGREKVSEMKHPIVNILLIIIAAWLSIFGGYVIVYTDKFLPGLAHLAIGAMQSMYIATFWE